MISDEVALGIDDEILFVAQDREGELRGVITAVTEDAGMPLYEVYVPDFPLGETVLVRRSEITFKILCSNTGLSAFEIADKVEYWDEEARRVCVGWVYEIDTQHREIVVLARGKRFSRFPEELRIVPPPRLRGKRDRKEMSDEQSDQQ
jgi:hypothetical protein